MSNLESKKAPVLILQLEMFSYCCIPLYKSGVLAHNLGTVKESLLRVKGIYFEQVLFLVCFRVFFQFRFISESERLVSLQFTL